MKRICLILMFALTANLANTCQAALFARQPITKITLQSSGSFFSALASPFTRVLSGMGSFYHNHKFLSWIGISILAYKTYKYYKKVTRLSDKEVLENAERAYQQINDLYTPMLEPIVTKAGWNERGAIGNLNENSLNEIAQAAQTNSFKQYLATLASDIKVLQQHHASTTQRKKEIGQSMPNPINNIYYQPLDTISTHISSCLVKLVVIQKNLDFYGTDIENISQYMTILKEHNQVQEQHSCLLALLKIEQINIQQSDVEPFLHRSVPQLQEPFNDQLARLKKDSNTLARHRNKIEALKAAINKRRTPTLLPLVTHLLKDLQTSQARMQELITILDSHRSFFTEIYPQYTAIDESNRAAMVRRQTTSLPGATDQIASAQMPTDPVNIRAVNTLLQKAREYPFICTLLEEIKTHRHAAIVPAALPSLRQGTQLAAPQGVAATLPLPSAPAYSMLQDVNLYGDTV